jgi:putative tryptophan/tyrosine transport system substrate-binding protein
MSHKIVHLTLCALLFALCSFAQAQQPGKTPRIGYLSGGSSSPPEAFLQGLRDLGYFEGKNINIEHRTGGKSDVYPDIMADLIRLKVAVIVVETSGAALAANTHDPDRHDNQHRSSRDRAHCQFCPAWRKRHRVDKP